ncbi:hypothetical protein ZWY2020_016418 [Hordeum vulgare]|nr:hypothetical protein ZWY2020_016418 [Hordeum vulgare]
MTVSSLMVLSLLFFASLTALLFLAPRVSSPPLPLPLPLLVGDEEVPPATTSDAGGAASSGGTGVEEGPEDLTLFRRVTLDVGEGAVVVSKVAFMFLANSDLTFAPLWECFFTGHDDRFNVYVHADPAIASTCTYT